jgi:hypothetical protein
LSVVQRLLNLVLGDPIGPLVTKALRIAIRHLSCPPTGKTLGPQTHFVVVDGNLVALMQPYDTGDLLPYLLIGPPLFNGPLDDALYRTALVFINATDQSSSPIFRKHGGKLVDLPNVGRCLGEDIPDLDDKLLSVPVERPLHRHG